MCKIFTKEKIKSNLAQKLLSMAVSLSLMLAMVPNNGAFAAEPTTFVTTAFANHWGRSDLRAYLNNGLATVAENGSVSNKKYGLNSTEGECNSNNTSGFAKQFSDAEYGLVQPFTYATNVLNSNEEATAVYETTDRFWLPSGNYSNNQIISWGAKDISANSQYSQTTTNDKDRIIPISYWSYGNSIYSWLRSPSFSVATLRSLPIAATLSVTTLCTAISPPRLPLVKFIWNLSSLHLRRQPHLYLSPQQAARKKLIFQAPQILVKKLPMRCLTTECT